ncbi:hypothetical protein [Tianweitania sediminis]|uniref:Uncharacterized protein n=1 Tax=Tianweitania sediminis TaxID=1502156 RepID=A0A8J7QX37_9HYPH|nr:hypothetical protein [Tianweitania sediminis]MBP0438338.1 hypothetical protein [Tianweitania sediminis]
MDVSAVIAGFHSDRGVILGSTAAVFVAVAAGVVAAGAGVVAVWAEATETLASIAADVMRAVVRVRIGKSFRFD